MANNKRRRNNNPKPEKAKVQAAPAEEAEKPEVDEKPELREINSARKTARTLSF